MNAPIAFSMPQIGSAFMASTVAVTPEQWRREMMAIQINSILRREARVRYFLEIGAAILLIALASFALMLADTLGFRLSGNLWRFDTIWAIASIAAGIAALVTGAQWWLSRTRFVRTELELLQLQFSIDRSKESDVAS